MNKAYIPQAKLATKAMHQKIIEMGNKSPNATMSVMGHSLGTMVSIQAIANLLRQDIAKLDKIILFQGPDARVSISKMSKEAQENIKLLEEQGKIEYYVNSFDIVSMLNRNKKGVDEIGKVHYLLPKTFTTTFDSGNPGSSHDFGQYQLNPDGTPKVANLSEHPYIFIAGIKISQLVDKYLKKIAKEKRNEGLSILELIKLLATGGYGKFQEEYAKIIADAKASSKWNAKISGLQSAIYDSTSSKQIFLRRELAFLVAKQANTIGEEYLLMQKIDQEESKDEINQVIREIQEESRAIQYYLESYEVESLIAPYKKSDLWDSGQATVNSKQAKDYRDKLFKFSQTLLTVSKNIAKYDAGAGKNLFN